MNDTDSPPIFGVALLAERVRPVPEPKTESVERPGEEIHAAAAGPAGDANDPE